MAKLVKTIVCHPNKIFILKYDFVYSLCYIIAWQKKAEQKKSVVAKYNVNIA